MSNPSLAFIFSLILALGYCEPNDNNETDATSVSPESSSFSFFNPGVLILITTITVIVCYCACCCIISFCECANFAVTSVGKSINLQADQVTMNLGEYSLKMAKNLTNDQSKVSKNSMSSNLTDSKSDKFIEVPVSLVAGTPYPDTINAFQGIPAARSGTPPPSKEHATIQMSKDDAKRIWPIKPNTTVLKEGEINGSALSSGMGQVTPPFSSSSEVSDGNVSEKKTNIERDLSVESKKIITSSLPISPMTAESISRSTISIPSTLGSPKSTLSTTRSETS